MRSARHPKNKKYGIYEHLQHYVRKTTYAQRLQWLQEANDWVRLLEKKKVTKKKRYKK